MVTRNGEGQRQCKRKGNADREIGRIGREKERKEKKVIEREEEAVKI